MKLHVELHEAELIRAGASPDEAHRRAAVAFGGLTRFQQEAREQRPLRWIDDLLHDARYGIRQLRRSPGFTSAAIATVGLGIAAVTTVFSIVNTASFKPVPYKDADRLVAIGDDGTRYIAFSQLTAGAIHALRHEARSFERVSAFDEDRGATLTRPGVPRALTVTAIDSGVLAMLATHPAQGRVPSALEFRDAKPVVLISDSLWRSRFGASDSALGAHITISGVERTVIGVMPEGFRFYERSDAWIPLVETTPPDAPGAATTRGRQEEPRYSVAARLAHGVSLGLARAEVAQIGRTLARPGKGSNGQPRLIVRDQLVDRPTALARMLPLSSLFLAATLALLVIACANVANLLLARAVNRRGEVTLRVALGAARGRLIRQLLTESAMLGVAACIIGVVLSAASVKLLITHVPTYGFPSWVRFGIDWRVLSFALVAMLVAVAAFGLAPAFEATRVNLLTVVASSAHPGITVAAAIRTGRRLVVGQIALSFALFLVATQLVATYRRVEGIDAGYQSDHVIHSYAFLDRVRYREASQRVDFVRRLAAELMKDPSIEDVAMRSWFAGAFARADGNVVSPMPATQSRTDRLRNRELFGLNDTTKALDQGFAPNLPAHFVVSDNYFNVIGVSTVAGRTFDSSDTRRTPHVAVLSAVLARRLWPTESSLGKTLRIGTSGTPFIVIGTVSDTRRAMFDRTGVRIDDVPELFVSEHQANYTEGEYLVRVKADAAQAKAAIAAAWTTVDPEAPPPTLLRTNAEEDGLLALGLRILGLALATIALMSLVLSMIGVYGVVSYTAARRTREIGIRVALGATSGDILRMIAVDGARLIIAGLAIGFVFSIGISKLLGRFVWSVSTAQLATCLLAAAAFCAVALVACYLPARRASRMQPRAALLTDI